MSAFRIEVPQKSLDRVRQRVESAHFGPTADAVGWQYGLDASWFRNLVDYWRQGYDWRAAEAEINRTPQYQTEIEGSRLHFAKLSPTSPKPSSPPLLLLHGWPYSFHTMLPLAQNMADRGFEVIVPSLPGYVFSAPASDEVQGLRFLSRRIDALMTQTLGYSRYLVHGGDHGAVLADWLAIDTPGHLLGVHCNMIGFRHDGAGYGSGKTGVSNPTEAERAFVETEVENMEKESAYFKLQLTRPETIGYALSDSPVGWAAYMLDKWQKWSDTKAVPFDQLYDRDRLLTEVMLYVLTDSVSTSLWAYAGFQKEPFGLGPGQTIDVPYGYSLFDDPLGPRPPKEFMAHSRTNLKLWRDHSGGGHFPMLQATDALADDIAAFAAMLQ